MRVTNRRSSAAAPLAQTKRRHTPVRRRLRLGLLAAIVLLYVLSIPWYRGEDSVLRLWLGFPDWVATALVCYVAVAVLNFVAWQLTDIPDPAPHPAADERSRA